MSNLFVEATHAEGFYAIVWNGSEFDDALAFLRMSTLTERLELWSREHAESPKGFAPIAWRDANSTRIFISNTLKMLITMPDEGTSLPDEG